ncbi:DUF6350 family protein [Williamsia sp. D3]|uniref:cell division protein PerM n=1 Tax=Williamsia sp. D3 TaxID=1313067 RepID=UPI0003D33044|nr:DUF6350 family protein [Williamsia sp. D3]ETD30307.1 hypothetical protein W823_24950 [Williamsia sp. D3]
MASSTAENLAARLREMRRTRRADEVGAADSARALVRLAFGTTAITLAILVVIAALTLVAVGDGLGSLPATVASMWLGIHQIPLTIGEVTIGVLPLAPTLLMVAAVARATTRVTDVDRPHSEVTAVILSAIGGPLLATILSLAVVMDASTVMTIQSPDALLAFACTFAVHAVGAGIGVGLKWWSTLVVRAGVADWVLKGLRCGVVAVTALMTLGAMVVAVRLVINWSVAGDLLASGNGWVGGLGLTLLSILYLPNMVIGAAGALVGAPVAVGGATVDLFGSQGGQVPPLPVLAALPDGGAGHWTALLLIGIAGTALFVGRLCLDESLLRNIRMVVVAAATSSLFLVIASVLAGGELGVLGKVGANLPVAGVFMFGWIAVIGSVTALVYSALPSRRRARSNIIDDDYYDDGRGEESRSDTDDEGVESIPVVDEAAIEFVPVDEQTSLDDDHELSPEPGRPEVIVDGWDPEDWALDEVWDDTGSVVVDEPIDAAEGEELVSTDDFGTRRTR